MQREATVGAGFYFLRGSSNEGARRSGKYYICRTFFYGKRSPGRGKNCATLTQEILLKNLIGTPMPDVTATCITGVSSAELHSQKNDLVN